MKNKSLTFAMLLSLSPVSVFGASSLSQSISNLSNVGVEPSIIKNIEDLKKRNLILKTRPAFCPLNSSRSDVILSSIKTIEAIFKDDCLDGNEGTLDHILSGAKTIQDNINESRKAQGKEKVEFIEMDTIGGTGVNGAQMASVVDGLNTLFNKNSCSNLDDSSFLENSANIIQNFSQFSLYSPSSNGISVAYGGLAASSILRFINNLFEGRFDFKDDADRLTFIKLNCSFYDVRIKMQEAGILDISTDTHYRDLAKIDELITSLKNIDNTIKVSNQQIISELNSVRSSHIENIGSERVKLLSPIIEMLAPLDSSSTVPVSAQRDIILDKLTLNYDLINNYVSEFTSPTNGSRVTRQNRSLRELIESIDEVGHIDKVIALEEGTDLNFNIYIKRLKYHFERIVSEVSALKEEATGELSDVTIVTRGGEELTVSEVAKLVKSGNGAKTSEQIKKLLADLNDLKQRLNLITGNREFTSEDGTDGADLRILEAHDKIANYIYGSYGKNFIDHMRKKSAKVNKLFVKDFKKFAANYLHDSNGFYSIKPLEVLNSEEVDKACISAKNLRATWKYAQGWAEMGYDFLSTNNDIFGETGSFFGNKRDSIFDNSQSAILARRIISAMKLEKKKALERTSERITVRWEGQDFSVLDAVAILKKNYRFSLGESMIDIQMTRDHNGLLQDLYGKYRCDLRANYEK